MNSKNDGDNLKDSEKIDGIPLRSAVNEFDPAEMFECSFCHRKTPPNRLDCIYCGKKLVLDVTQQSALSPVIRPPGDDVDGVNMICFTKTGSASAEQIDLVCRMTRLEENEIKLLLESGSAVPIARSESEEVARIAAKRMKECGLEVGLCRDSELESLPKPIRLRGISPEVDGNAAFILFNNDEVVRFNGSDIELIVVGIALENKIEADEKHKRKGLEKVLNTTEVSADEMLVDIYLRKHEAPFRLLPTGFDFSFLGSKKEFIASRNLNLTLEFLRHFAGEALWDESYISVRSALDLVWKIEEKQDTKEIKRKGFGSFQKTRITISSNLTQFAKYSGLQRLAVRRGSK